MSAEHTPGPWTAYWSINAGARLGEWIISTPTGPLRIARCQEGDARAAANAALIARAPALLAEAAALREALSTLDAAIRKAAFGDGPVRGNAPLSREWESVRSACIEARAALERK